MLLLGLWGLTVLVLWTYRRGRRLPGSLLYVIVGSLVVLAIWTAPTPLTRPLELGFAQTVSQLTIAPRAFSSIVYLLVLVAFTWGERDEAESLLVSATAAVVFLGVGLPLLFRLQLLLPNNLGVELPALPLAGSARTQVAQSAALIGGLYGQLLLFEVLRNRWEAGPLVVRSAISYAVGGWLHALLATTGLSFGSPDWLPAIQSELMAWTATAAGLWLLTAWVAWALGLQVATGFARQPSDLRESLRELFDLRGALQRSEDRYQRLNAQLRRLTEVRQRIVRADGEVELLQEVPPLLCRSEAIRACWIGLLSEGGELQSVARAGQGWHHPPPLQIEDRFLELFPAPDIPGGGPAEEELLTRLAEHRLHESQLAQGDDREFHSFPLRTGERLLGVLVIYPESQGLSSEHRQLLRGTADDLAYGLHRLRIEAARAQRVRELTAIREVTSDMISQPSVSRLLDLVTQRAVDLLDAQSGQIYLVRSGEEELDRVSQFGRELQPRDLAAHKKIAVEVATKGAPISRLRGDPGGSRPSCAATLSAPLTWQGRVTGVITVCRGAARPFRQGELEVLEIFASQTALALENARLLEAERQRSSQLERLRQASLSMTSSLELPTVLEAILEQTLQVVSASDAHIFLYDGQALTFGAALWASGDQREPFANPRENGLTYTVARSGERIVVEDASTNPIFADVDWGWNGAILGLPLIVGSRVLGVMNVAFDEPHTFSEEEVHILELLADQAAVILENARLFERTVGERQRLRLLYDVARALSGSLDTQTILQQAIELTTDNLGGLIGAISLIEDDSDRMTLVGLAGLPPERIEEINAQVKLEVGRGFLGWVAAKEEAALAADVSEDPRWRRVPGIDDDVQSAMAAPIFGANELVGVMAIFHTEKGVFGREHRELLTAICRQTGVAWSNAHRYRQAERRLAEQTALRQVAQVINSRLEMEPLLEAIVEQVREVLGYPVVDIVLVEGDELVLRAGAGLERQGERRLDLGSGVVGRVVRTGEPEFVPDVNKDPDYVVLVPDIACEIAVPLHKGEVIVGVLNVEAFRPGALGEEDVRLLTLLADQVSVAVENAALYDRLREHTAELEAVVADRTRELRHALNKAQEADRLKTQFVSDVSHELRTPLSNIQLYVELLRQAGSDRRGNYLDTLERETDRLVALIEDLLSISRLDAGSMPMDFQEYDLNVLAGPLVADRDRLFAERKLDLCWVPAEADLPVEADRQLLSRVLANLMTNAMNYTPAGGTVRVTTDCSEDGRWVTVSVRDTGLGIPEDELDKLFTRFFRGAASREMGNPGTGLGLAICAEIVERHQGRITVRSEEGQGSTFTVWLPRSRSLQPADGPGRLEAVS